MDSEHQVIVAVGVTNKQNDGGELVGMVEQIKDLTGSYPTQVSADAGYCSEANIVATGSGRSTRTSQPGGRSRHGKSDRRGGQGSGPEDAVDAGEAESRGLYESLPSAGQVVEPVFGQTELRGDSASSCTEVFRRCRESGRSCAPRTTS